MSAASCTVEIFSAPSSSRVMSNCSSRAIMISTWIQSIDCSGKVSSIHTSPSAGHFFSQSAGLSFVSYRVEGIGPEVDEFGGRADRLHIGSELLCNDRLHLLQGIRRRSCDDSHAAGTHGASLVAYDDAPSSEAAGLELYACSGFAEARHFGSVRREVRS
mmetsp:Transcript_2276/g.15159  ORF Transcript_2276/g.15159 Transcript_2276/m.15159 type:complete len:160 (-) Transcript_2276:99-578(-)